MAERTPARARAKVTAVARPRNSSTPALAKENVGAARNQGTPITKRPSESPPPESRAIPNFGDRESVTPPLTRTRPPLGGSNTQSWPSLPRAQPGVVAPPPPTMPPAQLGGTRPPSEDGSTSDAGGGRRVVRGTSASAVRPVVRPSSGKVTGVRRAAAATPAWASEDARERDALEASERQAREAQEAREREVQEARLAERERQIKDRARELELREQEAREREARREREEREREEEAREREERRAREEQEVAERRAREEQEAAERRSREEQEAAERRAREEQEAHERAERLAREEQEIREREAREREAREQEERERVERERKAREREAREREAREQAEEEARIQALSKEEQARIREREALEHMAKIKAKKEEEERIVREAREKALEAKRLQEEKEAKEREAVEKQKEEERQREEAAKKEVIEARARAARELAKPDRTHIQFDETTPLEELLTLLQSAQFQITDMHAEIQNLKNSVLQAGKAQSEKAIIFQNEKEEMTARIATLEEETKALKQENASLSSRKVGWGDETGNDDGRSMAGSKERPKTALELVLRPDTTTSWGSRPYTATSLASFASASSHASLVYSASPDSMRSVAEWIFPLQTRSLPPDKPYDRVLLPPNDPRREWLEGYVKGSLMHHRKSYDSDDWCPPPEVEIIRVSEVLNPTSSNAYGQQLTQMQEIWTTDREPVPELIRAIPIRTSWNGPRMNEVLLFHGCKWDAVFGILREGFDTRLGGTGTGAAFGIGSYFTTVASKADGYTERWEDWEHHPDVEVPPELRCMLIARVALGEIHEMEEADASLRRPPPGPNNVRCDSVLGVPRDRGGCVDYDEFVIYKPAQATPQFIVDYQHISSCQCRCCSRSKF